MPILRLNVKHSIFAQLMELEVWPSTASSVPTELCSTSSTSSVTGGSMWTALWPRISTPSMMSMLPRERQTPQLKVDRVSTVEAMEAAGRVEVMEAGLEVEETQEAPGEDQPRLPEVPTLPRLTATPSLRRSEPRQLEVTELREVAATQPRAGGGTPGSQTPPPSPPSPPSLTSSRLTSAELRNPTVRKCALDFIYYASF